MQTECYFHPSDRYVFDFGACHFKNGYAQVDTSQDASYFGTWANPTDRIIVTYCEGDLTVQRCDDDTEFVDAIVKIKTWNEENGHTFKGIDAMCQPDITNGFVSIGLGELLH